MVLVAAIAVSAAAFARYSGSAFAFILFTFCFLGLALLAIPQPRLYAYTFLAAFLVMGFWAKTLVHTIWALGFLEPVGDFANSAAEWDSALIAMSCAALGLIAARCGHLWYGRSRAAGEAVGAAPSWFALWRKPIWILTVLAVIGVNAANLHFAFFQIGVNPKLLLPMRLHVLASWLVNIGFALWVAALLWWDYKAGHERLGRNLFMPLVEAFFSSVSALSRIIYLVHAVPYWLALWERRTELAATIRRRQIVYFAGCFVLLFAAAVVTVFGLRVQSYPLIDRSTGAQGDANVGRNLARELPQLVVQRWVGLEGVLTVGSIAGRGPQLLVAAITDSPKGGTQSLYQRASKLAPYLTDPRKFTFLTNAGPVAILLFSGSVGVVCLGMALIGFVLILTEEVARRWTGNPFLLAVSGAALANVVSQTTFFYLTLIFLLQLWVAVGFLAGIERLRIRRAPFPV